MTTVTDDTKTITTTEAEDSVVKQTKKKTKKKKKSEKSAKTLLTWIGVVLVWAAVVLIDIVLVTYTATQALPAIAMWLFQTAGLTEQAAGLEALLAMWAVPLLFIAALLVVVEFFALRGVWRAGKRWTTRIRRSQSVDGSPSIGKVARTTTPHKTTRKKKK